MNNYLLTDTQQSEFDFTKLIKSEDCEIMAGIPVKIDKVLKDVTGQTVLGLSGTLVIKGVKFRGVWDCFGNPIEMKKRYVLLLRNSDIVESIFTGVNDDMFKLVRRERTDERHEK